jgi:hypothetical protein
MAVRDLPKPRDFRVHFGRGLAATTDTFGKLGEAPTHPQLLNWLAAELDRATQPISTLRRSERRCHPSGLLIWTRGTLAPPDSPFLRTTCAWAKIRFNIEVDNIARPASIRSSESAMHDRLKLKRTPAVWLGLFSLLCAAIPTCASEDVYLHQVKPLLREKCFACHGALKQEAGLRLDTLGFMRTGGKHGAAIEPGNAASSSLFQRIASNDPDERMPREAAPLSPEQIALIRRWIDDGAKAPPNDNPESDPREHWAFQKPTRPATPRVVAANAQIENPIDAFIAATHEESDLIPRPPADKATLLRRVYLDLVGTPPTRSELRAFLADGSFNAYDKVVQRLLDDPRHGERWARHWMDIWRYSDWYGRRSVNDVRNSYPHIWRWRDWIIRSLNSDKGYDRMTMEMLAADEIAPEDPDVVVATGFIARNWFALNADQWMKDQVEHTGKAFLGLTLNCAHCHDHKYDPISQKEYFAFRAFFEPLQLRHDRVPGGGPLEKFIAFGQPGGPDPRTAIPAGLVRVSDENLEAKTLFYEGGDARNKLTTQPPVEPAAPAIVGGANLNITAVKLPPRAWYPELQSFALEEDLSRHQKEVDDAGAAIAKARSKNVADLDRRVVEARLATARATLNSFNASAAAAKAEHLNSSSNANELKTKAATAERQAKLISARESVLKNEKTVASAKATAAAAKDDKAKTKAAAALKKATQAQTAAQKALTQAEADAKAKATSDKPEYTALGPTYPKTSTGRRTALARWIANPENPLTARVAINHIWARHFHEPIVEPVYDFGRNGGLPRFPKLLDWLAVEFMESGWSMKHVHRLIVTSAAYRRDAAPFASEHTNNRIDPDNHFLWRTHPHRMEAEVIRDSLLHVAGQTDSPIGGKELSNSLAEISRRRSVYFETFPEVGGENAFVALFDAPDPCDCYQRSESMVPQQALALTNSKLSLNQSRLLAQSMTHHLGAVESSGEQFIAEAFERILSRSPSDEERRTCRDFLESQREIYRDENLKQLVAKRPKNTAAGSSDPLIRSRESLIQALFSHNEFVTVR